MRALISGPNRKLNNRGLMDKGWVVVREEEVNGTANSFELKCAEKSPMIPKYRFTLPITAASNPLPFSSKSRGPTGPISANWKVWSLVSMAAKPANASTLGYKRALVSYAIAKSAQKTGTRLLNSGAIQFVFVV